MKSIFIFLSALFLLPFAAKSQDYQVDPSGNVVFTRIAECPGLSADDIYNRAKSALVFIYKNAKAVTQQDNPEDHYVIVKNVFPKFGTSNLNGDIFDCHYIFRIDCKDEKIRMQIFLTEYEIIGDMMVRSIAVSDCFPVNPKGKKISGMKKGWVNLMTSVENTLYQLELGIKQVPTKDDAW